MSDTRPDKPLGHKSYGSIGHLPGSKLGPGDHTINEGMARILTETGRNSSNTKVYTVIVEEKYDGSNVGIARIGGNIVALGRAGYPAATSPYAQHHWFATWVDERASLFRELLNDGERLCGEWMAVAHGLRYEIPDEPFVPFDIMTGHDRAIRDEFAERVEPLQAHGIYTPRRITGHDRGIDPRQARTIFASGQHPGGSPVLAPHMGSNVGHEGLVYRAEHDGNVCFLAKWVRDDFEPAALLPGIGRPNDAPVIINHGASHVVPAGVEVVA